MQTTSENISSVKERIAAQLMNLPGVHGVGVVQKRVADEPTKILSIIVHVDLKKSVDVLSKAEIIPPQIEGYPTDVIAHPRISLNFVGDPAPESVDGDDRVNRP